MNSSIFKTIQRNKFRLIRRFITETAKEAEKKTKLPEAAKKAKKSKKKIDWKKPAIVVFIMTSVPAYYFEQHYRSDYNYRLMLRESFPQYTKYVDAILPTNDPVQIFKVKTTLNEGTENYLSGIYYVIEKTKFNDKDITRKDIVNIMKDFGFMEYDSIYNQFLNNSLLIPSNKESSTSSSLSLGSFLQKLKIENLFDLIGQKEAADKIRQANKSYLEILEEREGKKKDEKITEEKINENSNVTVDEFILLCEKIITSKMLNEKEFVDKIEKYTQKEIRNNEKLIGNKTINVCGYDTVRKIYNLPNYNYVEENKKITNRILKHQNSDLSELNNKNKKSEVVNDKNTELEYLNEELTMLLQRKKDIELDIKETGDADYYAEDLKSLSEDIRKVKKEIWDKNNYTMKITYSALSISAVAGIILFFCNKK